MFWQYMKVAKFPNVKNKAPIERLIIMSWSPAQYPLQHFDVLPSHVSAWRGLQSNLYCRGVSLGWNTFQVVTIKETMCKNSKKFQFDIRKHQKSLANLYFFQNYTEMKRKTRLLPMLVRAICYVIPLTRPSENCFLSAFTTWYHISINNSVCLQFGIENCLDIME